MNRPNNLRTCYAVFVLLAAMLSVQTGQAQRPEKDYLSDIEADKIRDAETPNERVKLFLTFAEDRLKKFQYELDHPSPAKHAEMLNYLMNSYSGCVDDAADIIEVSLSKQENIRQAIDLMASKAKEFLDVLQKYASSGPDRETYKESLDDAIEGTQDALNDAEKSKKKAAPPPVRRKN
jgi:hypothetical protein